MIFSSEDKKEKDFIEKTNFNQLNFPSFPLIPPLKNPALDLLQDSYDFSLFKNVAALNRL